MWWQDGGVVARRAPPGHCTAFPDCSARALPRPVPGGHDTYINPIPHVVSLSCSLADGAPWRALAPRPAERRRRGGVAAPAARDADRDGKHEKPFIQLHGAQRARPGPLLLPLFRDSASAPRPAPRPAVNTRHASTQAPSDHGPEGPRGGPYDSVAVHRPLSFPC